MSDSILALRASQSKTREHLQQRLIENGTPDHEIDLIIAEQVEMDEALVMAVQRDSVFDKPIAAHIQSREPSIVSLEDGTAVQSDTLQHAILGADIAARYPRLAGRLVTVKFERTFRPVPIPRPQSVPTYGGVHHSGWKEPVAVTPMGQFI